MIKALLRPNLHNFLSQGAGNALLQPKAFIMFITQMGDCFWHEILSRLLFNKESRPIHLSQDITRLSFWQLFCYGALSLPIAMAGFALVTYIPTFYAVDMGLGLGVVGAVFVCGRVLDVITDPIIGYLSDRTQSALGPRRPWMIIGIPLFCFAAWALFIPVNTPNLFYLIVASGAYFLFYTALDVPYSAIGLEISPYIHERSILASTKAIFQVMGAIFAAILPFILALKTEPSLQIMTQILCGLCVLFLILFLKYVPQRESSAVMARPAFIKSIKLIWGNPIYSRMIFAFFIIQCSNALLAGLTVLFVTTILEMPNLTGLFLGVLFVSSALFLPVWIWVSKTWSKKAAWASSIIMAICILTTAPFLSVGDVIAALLFSAFIGATFGCDAIMPTSMLADIIYKDETSGNGRPAALYLAMKNSLSKLTFIAPMGLAFPMLERAGFVSGETNSADAVATLIFFYAGLPILLRIFALVIVWNLPKTESLFD